MPDDETLVSADRIDNVTLLTVSTTGDLSARASATPDVSQHMLTLAHRYTKLVNII